MSFGDRDRNHRIRYDSFLDIIVRQLQKNNVWLKMTFALTISLCFRYSLIKFDIYYQTLLL